MRFQIAELVVTPENEDTAKRLIEVTQAHESPELLFCVGPLGSGKSTFLEARGTEKDLLSTKAALYCHASEILAMLTIDSENAENFLNRVGEVDVLLIDDVEGFLENAVGPQACKLLVENRVARGLDTVVSCETPLSQLDERLSSVFANFTEVRMTPLSEAGAAALAKSYAQHFARVKGAQAVNELSDETYAFLGKKFCGDLKGMAPAVEYLVCVADLPQGVPVSAEVAESCLTL